ncbi:unnamed protein product [Choristocarpus tenellus]
MNINMCMSRSMTMSVDEPQTRAAALSNVVATAAAALAASAVPGAAFADGAKSLSTKARARGIYGNRIYSLDAAVKAGDCAAVASETNAFILFNSGVYSTQPDKKKQADTLSKAVISAANAGDKSALQSAYKEYIKYIEVKSGYSGAGDGQGFGSDYDYKSRTSLGTVYQR